MVLKIIVCILAGLGAGFATGFSGISAAVVISPALHTFLGFNSYQAICIALSSDVLASADASVNFGKHGNLRIKDSLVLLAAVLGFDFVGSWASKYIPSPALGSITVLMTLLMGVKFLLFPVTSLHRLHGEQTPKEKLMETLFVGAAIGFISGFAGAGGGMMTLFALTTLMGYEIKEAVGTSVFIMTFTALVGGVSHIALDGWPDPTAMIVCVVFTFIGATVSSRMANKVASKTLNMVTGIFLTALGAVMLLTNFIS